MKITFKFTASRVDEIEKTKGLPLGNCIADDTINNLALFIQKGAVDDNGRTGVSRTVALDMIDSYLEEHDKDELLLDIMEALCDGGFLSRTLDIATMRETMKKKMKQANETMTA